MIAHKSQLGRGVNTLRKKWLIIPTGESTLFVLGIAIKKHPLKGCFQIRINLKKD
ncbi:hypothetical protein VIS19158_19290 [Vibrio scophthalmi LMG 19158]|uniref:Uncharacterized protein n=1 Tax=Vibrio scophthalmi LMG 19158 TaxID=870967 RepID=F9RN30_9VIBR|nr:hypothetical protein VIS19158_19290 [Vibrio scophthalmi LMG 19158]